MEGGMSYADVQAAVEESVNIVSDPPVVMDVDLARQHIAALDRLPRPTLVTFRTGPRTARCSRRRTSTWTGSSEQGLAELG